MNGELSQNRASPCPYLFSLFSRQPQAVHSVLGCHQSHCGRGDRLHQANLQDSNTKNLHHGLSGKYIQQRYGSVHYKGGIQCGQILNSDEGLRVHLPGGPGGPGTQGSKMLDNRKEDILDVSW